MPTKRYEDDFYEELLEPDFAAGYLSECFQLGIDEFLLGLKDVVDAHGGVGNLSKSTELNRENLYTLLSEKGNPRLSSLNSILDALGIKLQFIPKGGPDEKEAA